MDSAYNDEIYANKETILQHRKGQQPRNVLRPQCLGQENQEMYYENRDSMHLPARTPHGDEKEMYEILGEKSVAALYEAPGKEKSANDSTMQSNVPLALETTFTDTHQVRDCTYDDVKQDSHNKPSQLKTRFKRSSSESRFVEQIEMKNLKVVDETADNMREIRNQVTKLRCCVYIIPLSLIIGLAALLIGILIVVGIIKTNECACMQEIARLRSEIANLKSRNRAPLATSAMSSTSLSLKITPTHASSWVDSRQTQSRSISSIPLMTQYSSNYSLATTMLYP